MKSLAEDIKDLLIADASLDLVFAQNCFIAREPVKGDCITIFETPGLPIHSTLDLIHYRHESIQIRVRGKGYKETWDWANKIMLSLHGRANITINGSLYIIIFALHSPALLDWDDNGNFRLIINFKIQRKEI